MMQQLYVQLRQSRIGQVQRVCLPSIPRSFSLYLSDSIRNHPFTTSAILVPSPLDHILMHPPRLSFIDKPAYPLLQTSFVNVYLPHLLCPPPTIPSMELDITWTATALPDLPQFPSSTAQQCSKEEEKVGNASLC